MKESIRNHAGCPDPTAFEAISRVMKEEKAQAQYPYMPFVYICSPFAGDVDDNIKRAQRFCRNAVELGYIPVAPHLHYPQFLNDSDPDERKLGLFMGLVWLTKCVELWVCGNIVSEGMVREIRKAKARNMPIRYFNDDLSEVLSK